MQKLEYPVKTAVCFLLGGINLGDSYDVLIIGAGLSGIGAACQLATDCSKKSFAILEARTQIGGTWDLFRYPGIRGDSPMYALGYDFQPWKDSKIVAEGASILEYIQQTAIAYGVDEHIRYEHKVVSAHWSTEEATWTVEVECAEQFLSYRCRFLYSCAGYYNYQSGYTPEFPGRENFSGDFIHPQSWPQNFSVGGKRVVVIGSGATAVTLAPAIACKASHVTLLQRSPSYVLSLPSHDRVAPVLRRVLPQAWVYQIMQFSQVVFEIFLYRFSRSYPALMRRILMGLAERQLGVGQDMAHFSPRYDPWEQRLCIDADGEFFKAIRSGLISVVTDTIERFTEKGVLLSSGEELKADVIVSATGLNLEIFSGIQLVVDGSPFDPYSALIYKGAMLSDLPNFAFSVGYYQYSWSLKTGATNHYVCRLLNHMDRTGARKCTPRRARKPISGRPLMALSSGYVNRGQEKVPQTGSRRPWRLRGNPFFDSFTLKYGALINNELEFSNISPVTSQRAKGISYSLQFRNWMRKIFCR